MSETFKPTDAARAILKGLRNRLGDDADKEFFDTWEAEISDPDAPRMAGSIVASAYMRLAARYGVFGANCAGREPNLQLWLVLAEQEFHDAVKDVARAKDTALSRIAVETREVAYERVLLRGLLNTGELDCYRGGDLCICDRYGT